MQRRLYGSRRILNLLPQQCFYKKKKKLKQSSADNYGHCQFPVVVLRNLGVSNVSYGES